MKYPHTAWQRLIAAAHQAPAAASKDAAPFGFSTRVAALAMMAEVRPSLGLTLNRLAWRALSLSLMLMMVSIATHFASVPGAAEAEQETSLDPVEEILTLS